MSDPAVIALSSAIVLLVGGLLAACLWVRQATDARATAEVAVNASDAARILVGRERDDALAGKAQSIAERDEARQYAASLAKSLADARGELSKYVRASLASGSDADVAATVDRLLGSPVPTVRPADAPAGPGDGPARSGTVPGP